MVRNRGSAAGVALHHDPGTQETGHAVGTRYEHLIRQHIVQLYARPKDDLEVRLGARASGNALHFRAFGEPCSIGPEGITLSGTPESGPRGLIVSLYALHAGPQPLVYQPFKAFRDLPNSMPYQGAFTANSERVLVPHVGVIRKNVEELILIFDGREGPPDLGGDFSLTLHPLPKIALAYIFYEGDEEFPPSATCLFSANALSFLPLDGLADVAEHTSREILRRVSG